jgi:hypothetical protein
MAVVGGLLYLISSSIITIIAKLSPMAVPGLNLKPGFLYIVTATSSGLIGGFIFGVIVTYSYNFFATKIGGIKIKLR